MAPVVKNTPDSAGDLRYEDSIPGLGRSPGEGHGNPLQYSYLKNPTNRWTWRVTVHRVAKRQLKQLSMHLIHCIINYISIKKIKCLPRVKKIRDSQEQFVSCASRPLLDAYLLGHTLTESNGECILCSPSSFLFFFVALSGHEKNIWIWIRSMV